MSTSTTDLVIKFDLDSPASYSTFLKVKSLPRYRILGRTAIVPREYAHLLGTPVEMGEAVPYQPIEGLFDYQAGVSRIAIRRKKFCVFSPPGRGKTLCYTELARHAVSVMDPGQCVLITTPAMVVDQFAEEIVRFYGDRLPVRKLTGKTLSSFLASDSGKVGIVSHESLKDSTPQGRLGCLVVDEMGIMKSHYGRIGSRLLRLSSGLQWIMGGTGVMDPNDRIEYAMPAVLMGAFPTVNAFLSKFFVNKGETGERWVMKPHALEGFYRSLSDWCIFLNDPATYGFKDNVGGFPNVNVRIHDVELTDEQSEIAMRINGTLFPVFSGGITKRSKMGQLAKGRFNGEDVSTLKPRWIADRVKSRGGLPGIIWCKYDAEQDSLERLMPDAASVRGSTPMKNRIDIVRRFQQGNISTVIAKYKTMGLGLNLQAARYQIFSTLEDSYETLCQCIGRSNRYGSVYELDVDIPITELERPMVESVLRKAARIRRDVAEQERMFQGSVPGGAFHAAS